MCSVDSQTDAVVHGLIRTEFEHHTVIAIAHRLDSILDFDQVIYMDKGQIREVGNPMQLRDTPFSAFRGLYLDSHPGYGATHPAEGDIGEYGDEGSITDMELQRYGFKPDVVGWIG